MRNDQIISCFRGDPFYARQHRCNEVTPQFMYDQTNCIRMLLPEATGKNITPVAQEPRSLLYPCPRFFGNGGIILQGPAHRGRGKGEFLAISWIVTSFCWFIFAIGC